MIHRREAGDTASLNVTAVGLDLDLRASIRVADHTTLRPALEGKRTAKGPHVKVEAEVGRQRSTGNVTPPPQRSSSKVKPSDDTK
jgi:hypothetical protein